MTDVLTKLFGSPARVKLLRLFLFNPRQTFTAPDAASRARVSKEEAKREIKLFVDLKLVSRNRMSIIRYGLNSDFPYILALQNLLLNAPSRAEDIQERLRGTGVFKLIVVAGVFVGEWEGRVDLLIVADRVKEDKLRHKIRLLESEIGKEIRYTLLSSDEFFYRMNMNDHLVRDVLDYTHTIVFDSLDIGLE